MIMSIFICIYARRQALSALVHTEELPRVATHHRHGQGFEREDAAPNLRERRRDELHVVLSRELLVSTHPVLEVFLAGFDQVRNLQDRSSLSLQVPRPINLGEVGVALALAVVLAQEVCATRAQRGIGLEHGQPDVREKTPSTEVISAVHPEVYVRDGRKPQLREKISHARDRVLGLLAGDAGEVARLRGLVVAAHHRPPRDNAQATIGEARVGVPPVAPLLGPDGQGAHLLVRRDISMISSWYFTGGTKSLNIVICCISGH